jgi:hypothetical protein
MNVELTEKRRWFLERMTQSPEQAQWGFELLLKRDDFSAFFDHLRDYGLFSPANNPAPVAVEQGKYLQVPYWPALDYLKACASLAGRDNDTVLAEKILGVVREVTNARLAHGGQPDNHHTHWKFAEILGDLPTISVTKGDIDLIPAWLDSRFDRGMVGHTLDKGLMRKLLASRAPEDWSKASRVLWHCSAIVWVDEEGLEKKRRKPISVMDDYWLKEFIQHNAAQLGAKARGEAVDVFADRVREVYSESVRAKASWLFRPAIEEHKQNHSWGGADNRFVEGMRDAVVAWVDADAPSATPYVDTLLGDKAEIVRRVAIHVLNERWDVLRSLLQKVIEPGFFDNGHLHELYGLLRGRFSSFTDDQKLATIEAIREIQPSASWKEPDLSLKRVQRTWLSAISGKGSEAADAWYAALQADDSLGRLSEYPDFHTYMESSWGPGPTPFRAEELIEFAKDGSIIQQLNAFEPQRVWRGPTKRALVDALEEAIGLAPSVFLEIMPTFVDAGRPYQYGLINGFKRLWDEPKGKTLEVPWDQAWPALMSFFESLLRSDDFWIEPVAEDRDLTPTRNWIPSIIAEFLRAGTREDKKSYDPGLLSRGWQLICILLERSEPAADIDKDAMTQAINTEKGKALEALFSHALRTCRVADRIRKTHVDDWDSMRPVFDAELSKCRGTNFEFSTLAGAYLANIEYLAADWLELHVDEIFPADQPDNFFCAVSGLTYAPATRSIFGLLVNHGVLDRALKLELRERSVRERLVERIALAYLWGDEELNSSRFNYFFDENRFDDLQIAANFFWSVSNQELKPEHVAKILDFWRACAEWSRRLRSPPVQLLSHLSRLSVYLKKLGAEEAALLEEVAPHVNAGYNADYFVEQLLRLVSVNPGAVSTAFGKMLETYEPTFDYEDRLKTLVRALAGQGLKEEALGLADRLRGLPGMREIFSELVQ